MDCVVAYYNSAFENKFMVNIFCECVAKKLATQLPDNFTMGYMEQKRKE